MTDAELNKEIYKRFGAVTRARGCHLYTKKGVRLTDLYQMNGRAILGWGGGDVFTRLKNILNRGLTGNFITEYDCQIIVAVEKLLGKKCKIFWTVTRNKAEEIASEYSKPVFYRPWAYDNIDYKMEKAIIIEPSMPWTENIFLVAVDYEVAGCNAETGDFIPAPLKAAVTRSIYDLIDAIDCREEKNWFIYDQILCKYWTRKGPYLFTKVAENKYDDFVKACLDCGIVINPCYIKPSIVPFGADKGVFTKLRDLNFGV